MGKFDFLCFKEKQIKAIEDYIDSKYNEKLEEWRKAYKEAKESRTDFDESFEEIFCEIFIDRKIVELYEKEFCSTILKEIDLSPIQKEDESILPLERLNRDYQKREECIQFLKQLIQNLCIDVDVASFMFMGYYDAEDCIKTDGMSDLIYYLSTLEDEKREEYKQIISNFPFAFEIGKRIENWCYNYKKELCCLANISIFDLGGEIKAGYDLTRYRFSKTKRIYDKIFSDKIENTFMLENSLGVSLTNIIYGYCRHVKEMGSYNKIKKIIQKITEIYGIYSRNNFACFIFDYLSYECFSDTAISEAERMVDLLAPIINERFIDLLRVDWWWKIKEEKMNDIINRKKYMKTKRKELYNLCGSFYNDQTPYKDLVESLGLYYFEKMDGFDTNMRNNLERLFIDRDKLDQIEKDKKYYGQAKKETDSDPNKNINMLDYIKEINKDNYRQTIESSEKIQMKLPKRELDRNMLYALIHCDVTRSGLQFFGKEIYKQIKRSGA